MKNCALILGFVFIFSGVKAQVVYSGELNSIISNYEHSAQFDSIMENKETAEIQIIFTRIIREEGKTPVLEHYNLINNGKKYFYPASLVKLPTSIFCIEKLNENFLSTNDYYKFIPYYYCKRSDYLDRNKQTFKESLTKMLVVSDNQEYNALYDFLTPSYIKDKLEKYDLSDIIINNRFAACDFNINFQCNGMQIYKQTDTINPCYTQALSLHAPFHNKQSNFKGNNHWDRDDKPCNGPYDFTYSNKMTLESVHEIMLRLIMPEQFPNMKRFKIDEWQRSFLIEQLGMFARETEIEELKNFEEYPDNLTNFFILANQKSFNSDSIEIYNIVGQSYGFTSECAYIKDTKNNVDFFLSAVIYTNANNTINDGKYEYKEIAIPFLGELANFFLSLEQERINTNNYVR